MPPGPQPSDLATVRSMFPLARIFALISLVVFALIAVFNFLSIFGIVAGVIYAVIAFLSYLVFERTEKIRKLVEDGRFEEAKSETMPWMIIGLFTLLLPGLFLILAYIKYDDLINWKRTGTLPGWPTPMPGAAPPTPGTYAAPSNPFPPANPYPPAAAAPPAPPAAPGVATCPRCGRPATWVPQYGRWYCYPDQQYL